MRLSGTLLHRRDQYVTLAWFVHEDVPSLHILYEYVPLLETGSEADPSFSFEPTRAPLR